MAPLQYSRGGRLLSIRACILRQLASAKSAKAAKSLPPTACCMAAKSVAAEATQALKYGEVVLERSMPSVEGTAFGAVSTMATTTRSGHASLGSSCSARQCGPARTAKPPWTERAAEAEPRRAKADISAAVRPSPQWASTAAAKAAKPAAEEAKPAAVGKLLRLLTAKGGMGCSRRQLARVRSTLPSAVVLPLRRNRSAGASATVVVAVRLSKVMDRDGVAGRLPGASCLPQYFSSAMFGWATAVVCMGAWS